VSGDELSLVVAGAGGPRLSMLPLSRLRCDDDCGGGEDEHEEL
jgi:hypothetical protein